MKGGLFVELAYFFCEEIQLNLHRSSKLHIWDIYIQPRNSPANTIGINLFLILLIFVPRISAQFTTRNRNCAQDGMKFPMKNHRDRADKCLAQCFCVSLIPKSLLKTDMVSVASSNWRLSSSASFLRHIIHPLSLETQL